jgi:hypothetical protein
MQIFKARILLIHVERVCRPPANVRSTPDGKVWVRTDVVSWSESHAAPEVVDAAYGRHILVGTLRDRDKR